LVGLDQGKREKIERERGRERERERERERRVARLGRGPSKSK
jgi:hypothetical protein